MTVESSENKYVLSPDWEPERRRLGLLEHVFDPGARSRLTELGVGPGARCLEIGAGGGSMTQWLCGQVGPTGSVTAIDLDTRWLQQLVEPNLTVAQHNLLTDDFPADSFDFIYARAVFEHIADRGNAVPRVIEWLAPGGWLYLENFSLFAIDSSPEPAYIKAIHAFSELIGVTGTDYTWARTFPRPLIDADLAEVGASFYSEPVRGGEPFAEWISLSLQSLTPRIADAGLATESEMAEAVELLADPAFWDLGPVLLGAWGRRKR